MEHELFSRGPSPAVRLTFFILLSLLLLVSDVHYSYLKTLRAGIATAIYPLQRIAMMPVELLGAIGDYTQAQSSLIKENAILQKQNLEDREDLLRYRALQQENDHLRQLFGAKARVDAPSVMAEILYDERDPFSRKVIVDKGLQAHVIAGSAVIDNAGVIGQVLQVYPFSSEISLITDKDHPTPVQVLRNGLRGVAYGGVEPGTLDLRFMASNADVVNGDVVVTSGIDGVYPPGLSVATVTRVERTAKDQFARIVLTPAAGVHNHTTLLVLQPDRSHIPPPPEAAPRRDADKRGKAVRK